MARAKKQRRASNRPRAGQKRSKAEFPRPKRPPDSVLMEASTKLLRRWCRKLGILLAGNSTADDLRSALANYYDTTPEADWLPIDFSRPLDTASSVDSADVPTVEAVSPPTTADAASNLSYLENLLSTSVGKTSEDSARIFAALAHVRIMLAGAQLIASQPASSQPQKPVSHSYAAAARGTQSQTAPQSSAVPAQSASDPQHQPAGGPPELLRQKFQAQRQEALDRMRSFRPFVPAPTRQFFLAPAVENARCLQFSNLLFRRDISAFLYEVFKLPRVADGHVEFLRRLDRGGWKLQLSQTAFMALRQQETPQLQLAHYGLWLIEKPATGPTGPSVIIDRVDSKVKPEIILEELRSEINADYLDVPFATLTSATLKAVRCQRRDPVSKQLVPSLSLRLYGPKEIIDKIVAKAGFFVNGLAMFARRYSPMMFFCYRCQKYGTHKAEHCRASLSQAAPPVPQAIPSATRPQSQPSDAPPEEQHATAQEIAADWSLDPVPAPEATDIAMRLSADEVAAIPLPDHPRPEGMTLRSQSQVKRLAAVFSQSSPPQSSP